MDCQNLMTNRILRSDQCWRSYSNRSTTRSRPERSAEHGGHGIFEPRPMTLSSPKVVNRSRFTELELWFQQDGATCHTARAPIDLLKDTFGDRLISRFGPVNWPPRSCDLTPLDYFLWGYVKALVYADTPQTLDHLEDNIRRVIADIRPQMLEKLSKIGRPDWTTSQPAVAVLCQKSYLKLAQQTTRPALLILVFIALGTEVHEHMFRPGGQSDKKPLAFRSQANLVLVYRPTEGMEF
ncbi:transposable element Tc3 transposase [Trichonephila clavipes]|nr:transposable element Tc3 transposase [Trichonephila clavipes]